MCVCVLAGPSTYASLLHAFIVVVCFVLFLILFVFYFGVFASLDIYMFTVGTAMAFTFRVPRRVPVSQ